jgi:hypothetical protein
MAEFVIKVTRFDELKRFPEIAGTEFADAMTVSVEKLLGDAQILSPVYLGLFRSSLDNEVVQKSPIDIKGSVFATAPYSPVIEGVDEAGNPTEFGRRPGTKFPPVGELRTWVERTMGLTGSDAARVAYLIGRAIVKRGIRPKRPLGRSLEKNIPFIEKVFNDAGSRVAKRLEGKL